MVDEQVELVVVFRAVDRWLAGIEVIVLFLSTLLKDNRQDYGEGLMMALSELSRDAVKLRLMLHFAEFLKR
ncbi:hypothetical protein ES705_24072 [subsurface metagenome]